MYNEKQQAMQKKSSYGSTRLSSAAINRNNMTAPDLFLENAMQVFSKKTGDYLGLIIEGESNMLRDDLPAAPIICEVFEDVNQLVMF